MARPKSRGELKPLNVNIDADISNELTKKANETGIPKTTIVEKALKEYFEKHQKEFSALK